MGFGTGNVCIRIYGFRELCRQAAKQFPNRFFRREAEVYCSTATSIEGFVQQLAVGYITHGYWFYVTGTIPDHKDPGAVDAKLLARYGIARSKWTRCRRKQVGLANVQYLRHGRFFILIATSGEHPFFAAEAARLRDVREYPVQFHGYSIGCRLGRDGRRYHASVRIGREAYRALKSQFEHAATHRSVEELRRALRALPFSPFAPVRRQFCALLRMINRRRKTAGLELLSWDALRLRRRSIKPFGPD